MKSESAAERFDGDRFIEDLIEAVGRTEESYNARVQVSYKFENTPFPITVSNGGSDYSACFVIRVAPTNEELLKEHLELDMTRGIKHGIKKLERAKQDGEQTILLLDSTDHALVNEAVLAKAFTQAVSKDRTLLKDIDEVYLLHARRLVAPLKLRGRLYPDLPEFREYIIKEYNL